MNSIETPLKTAPRASTMAEDIYYQQDYEFANEIVQTTESDKRTILFYIRVTNNAKDDVVQLLQNCLFYLMKKQKVLGQQLVGTIYLEKWCYDLIKPYMDTLVRNFYPANSKVVKIWPVSNIEGLPIDANKMLQQEIDMIYALGGDGTLLSLLRALYTHYSKVELPPIAAFNLGSLGYLCNFHGSEYMQVIDSTIFRYLSVVPTKDPVDSNIEVQMTASLQNESSVDNENLFKTLMCKQISHEMKMRLIAKIDPDQNTSHHQRYDMQAMNEISITRGMSGGMCSYEIYVNDILLTVVQGDGILIATPTGSTAYNLSCGGSIVHNAAQVICLTPICPHSLSFRPIILPVQNCELAVRLSKPSRQASADVTIDGQVKFELKQNETLRINESPYKVPFIHWKSQKTDQIWANKLNNQLHWNTQVLPNGQIPLKGKM